MKLYVLMYFASKFVGHKNILKRSKLAINEHSTFNDSATIRRELYDNRFLDRNKDCSAYWLEENQPEFSNLGIEGN